MSTHVGEKCGKRADGDPDGRTDGDPDGRTETGRRVGRTDRDPDGHHHTIIRPVQLNISKHVREKCGKLHIAYILSS